MPARVDYQEDRHLPRIVPGAGGCWIWTGTIESNGYGRWQERGLDRGRCAHTVIWETLTCETVPEDMQLDHLCLVRACVNPAHLELVTRRINLDRRNVVNGWRRLRPAA